MSGLEFELATAEEKLKAARLKMREYFNSCKYPDDVENLRDHWHKLFDKNISRALKRQPLYFNFGAGGGPGWYVEIFAIFSEVLLAEYEHGKLMARKFNPPEFGMEEDAD